MTNQSEVLPSMLIPAASRRLYHSNEGKSWRKKISILKKDTFPIQYDNFNLSINLKTINIIVSKF